jgi:hypothetical protein
MSQSKPRSSARKALTHIRRCHICSKVTEKEYEIVKSCEHCGKVMAPFYFFNEQEVDPISDCEGEPIWRLGERKPVRGFTAFW